MNKTESNSKVWNFYGTQIVKPVKVRFAGLDAEAVEILNGVAVGTYVKVSNGDRDLIYANNRESALRRVEPSRFVAVRWLFTAIPLLDDGTGILVPVRAATWMDGVESVTELGSMDRRHQLRAN